MTGDQLKKLAKQIPSTAFDIIIKDRQDCELFFTVPHGTPIKAKNATKAILHPYYAKGDRYRIRAKSE